jgi:signal transduction histidine kinase
MKSIDPLCGMTVSDEDKRFTSSYKGITYHFCSAKCKLDFDEDPEAVLAMQAARERSIESDRAASLDKMIDEVAHEVRNPLTSIGGFARKVYKRLPEGDPNKEYMDMIIKEVNRLEHIIREFITLSTFSLRHIKSVNVNDIIHDAVELFKEELKKRNIKIILDLTETPPMIDLDSKGIKTVIANLLRNAVEAIDTTPAILKISTRVKNEIMNIEISDTGRGIPEDKIKYIFDPLYTSKIYGPGLGLTFVKRIIEEHGGSISVESKTGKGSVSTISLPLRNL